MGVALVTGGSRGVGKGIVEGLAEAGETVVFSGRDEARLVATAEEAARLGGTVLARRVDHCQDEEVGNLFAELSRDYSLDLLVNNAWGGYEGMVEDGRFNFTDPFWQQPLSRWEGMMQSGVRAAFVASQLATRIMLEQSGGLIINISFWPSQKFTGNTLYGMAKAATDKMTADMAMELRETKIRIISLYPGLVRTERVMENADYLDLSNSESPRFIGRVIAALKRDENLLNEFNGKVAVAADIARGLGVKDIDGRSPEPLTLEEV